MGGHPYLPYQAWIPPRPPERGFGARYGAALAISMTVLFAEAVIALIAQVAYAQTQFTPSAGYHVLGFVALAFLAVPGAVVGFVVSAGVVLPLVGLAEWAGRRVTRRERGPWWGVPLVTGVVVAVLVGSVGPLVGAGPVPLGVAWAVATAVLTVAGLAARPAVVARDRSVDLLWLQGKAVLACMAAVPAAAVLAVAALSTGLLQEYSPPRLTRDTIVGAWSDGHGGTIRFAPDGTVTATGLDHRRTDWATGEDVVEECAGTGRWAYERGDGPRTQKVEVSGDSTCLNQDWEVGGTPGDVMLYVTVGDPDSWDLYELRPAR
ncbi:hypothetical protein [Streptomyces sp. NPDC047928]|uniref:hypothetical protein n=1 Tax=unclassified Streptomyces TaxID=2593676 RepID=UPI00371AEDC7